MSDFERFRKLLEECTSAAVAGGVYISAKREFIGSCPLGCLPEAKNDRPSVRLGEIRLDFVAPEDLEAFIDAFEGRAFVDGAFAELGKEYAEKYP